ncbi:MAG: gliding motility-associated C-terminal domain-containing protein [Crocinitomicaceae bacterium]
MKKYIYILYLLSLGFVPTGLVGQINTLGDATPWGSQCGCYELTPALGNKIGGIYENTDIDITNPFNLKFTVLFGDDNFSGDGVAFSLQAGGSYQLGNGKWGLGIGGVANEVHVEFDTRYSHIECGCANNDNGVDHLGLFKDGSITHGGGNDLYAMTGPANPHPLIGGVSDIEDGQFHNVEIDYDGANTITVTVDGVPQVLTMLQTLSFYLGGATNAKWGWTGATPTANSISNSQVVCLANSNTIDYSLVNCQNTVMDFNTTTFSFYPIVNYTWYFDPPPPNGVSGQTVQHTFTTPGIHTVIVQTEDVTGCVGSDTLEIGVGFEIQSSASQTTVCPGATVDLESEAVFYVPPSCNYVLMMGDLFCDGWSGSEIDVIVNGTLFGTYSPPNVGCGGAGWQEFTDLVLPDGANVDINFNYAGVFGAEIYYQVFDPSGNLLIDVTAGTVNGDISDNFQVDCGVQATTYSYQWMDITNPPGTAGPADSVWNGVTVDYPGGQYEIQITNNQTNCVVTDVVNVATYDTVSVSVSGDATICQGDCTPVTFTFTGTPPFDVTFSTPTGSVTETGINAMSYTYTVCNGGMVSPTSVVGSGCPGNVYGNATITEIPLPNVSIGSSATYCLGDVMNSLTATSSNGGSIFWWDNAANVGDTTLAIGNGTTFDPNAQGYTSTVTIFAQEFSIPDGCGGATDQVVLTILNIPVAPTVVGTTTYCDGDAISPLTVTPAPSGTIIWTNGSMQLATGTSYTPSNLNIGSNVIYVKEDNGTCAGDSSLVTVIVKPTPSKPGIFGDTTYCSGDTPTALTATATLGGTILWSTGAAGPNMTPTLTVGQVSYCASETLNGCTGPDSCVVVTTYVDPAINIPSSASICIGDSVLICAENNGIFPPDIIQWDHGPTTDCVYLGPPANEQYQVCLTNPACGTVCDTINIVVYQLPIITAGDDQTTGLGGEVTMWADGAIDYVWTPYVECQSSSCNSVYAVPSQTTYYYVTGTDENGCVNRDSVLISVDGEMQVYIPNIFSPDGNGQNDVVRVMGPRLTDFEFKIFDRWGRMLFETTDQKLGWDGTFNGNPVPQQVVTYIVKGIDVLGREVKRGGNIMVSR